MSRFNKSGDEDHAGVAVPVPASKRSTRPRKGATVKKTAATKKASTSKKKSTTKGTKNG